MEEEGMKNKKACLRAYHEEAIEQLYCGKSHKEIASYLVNKYKRQFTINKIGKWFMDGGFLEKEYNKYAKRESEERQRILRARMNEIIQLIPEKLQALLTRKGKDGKEISDLLTLKTITSIWDLLGLKNERDAED